MSVTSPAPLPLIDAIREVISSARKRPAYKAALKTVLFYPPPLPASSPRVSASFQPAAPGFFRGWPCGMTQGMEPIAQNVNFRMQRTATLAQEVLERAKTRKLNWPLPTKLQQRMLQEGFDEDAHLAAAFASVAEHMGHISAECENYYCSVPPFQFKEYEVAHIFRYHSKQASENLLKAFKDEESKPGPVVEESGCADTESSALIPANTSNSKDIYIDVAPGTYTVGVSSHEDTIKQSHLIKILPGQSVNLTFNL